MLNQFHNSIIGLLLFLVSVLLLFTLSLNWANFKNLYKIEEINIYGTTFFDQSIIKEKSDILKSYSIFEKELKSSIFADQFLVLKGLNDILDYNE